MEFKLPTIQNRVAIIGRTGSGKTQLGAWLLSNMPFNAIPFIIFDFKGDDLLNSLGAKHISLKDNPPTKPGLYIVSPHPAQEEETETFLWKIWGQGNTGVYVDEGYMVARSKAYNAIQTQGRSLNIPTITLTQRPVFAPRFVFSEADYFAIFQLNKRDDNKTVGDFTTDYDFRKELPQYQCRWFDVKQNGFFILLPAPSRDNIIESFNTKLKRNKRVL